MATANAEDIRYLYVAAAPLTRAWGIEPDPEAPTTARDTAAQLQLLQQDRPDDTFLERTRALWVLVEKWPTSQEIVNVAEQLAHDIRRDLSRALLEPETAFTWAPNTTLTIPMPPRMVDDWERIARDAVLADTGRRTILQRAADAAIDGINQRTPLVTYATRAGEPTARPEQIAAVMQERDANLERLRQITANLDQRGLDVVPDDDDLIDAARIGATWEWLDRGIDAAIDQIEHAGGRASRPISIRQIIRDATPQHVGLADLTPRIDVALAQTAIRRGPTARPDPIRTELERQVLHATLKNATDDTPVGADDLIDPSAPSAEESLREALQHLRHYDQATTAAQRRTTAAETFIRRYNSILGRDVEPLLAEVRTQDTDRLDTQGDPQNATPGELIDRVRAVAHEILNGWSSHSTPESRANAIRAVDAIAERVSPGFEATVDSPLTKQPTVSEAVVAPRDSRGPAMGR